MYQILRIAMIAITLSSFTTYYKGKKSDHFDGARFYDPEVKMPTNLFTTLKWQFGRKRAAGLPIR